MSDEQQATPEEESPISPVTKRGDGRESIDQALKRFQGQVHRSRVLRTYRQNMSYMNPPEVGVAEYAKHVARAIVEIDEPCRSVFILREIQNLNVVEIAEALDMPTKTVKIYIRRVRSKLREQLRETLDSETSDPETIDATSNLSITRHPTDTDGTDIDIRNIEHRDEEGQDLRLSTRLSIAIFESDHIRRVAMSALVGLGISAIVIAIGYGLSLLNPSGSVLDVLILVVTLMSLAGTVLASKVIFKSDRHRNFKYLF